jgi:phage/plasmid-like protein (TIGR03299 family)
MSFRKFQVNSTDSIQSWMEHASLNWNVQRRKLFMRCQPNDQYAECEIDHHAIVRATDGRVFQVASKDYVPAQNQRMLEDFRHCAEAGEMPIEAVGHAKGGAIVWALAKAPDSFMLQGADRVDSYILFGNSHDGSISYKGTSTTVRPACENTLAMALRAVGGDHLFSFKHTAQLSDEGKMELRRRMKELMREHSNAMFQFADQASLLAESKIRAQAQVRQYILQLVNPGLLNSILEKTQAMTTASGGSLLESMVEASSASSIERELNDANLGRVGSKILDAIIDSPGSELPSAAGTWWGVLNGVTYYVDHVAGKTDDTRLTASWFGQRANLKQNALELALQYAGGESN